MNTPAEAETEQDMHRPFVLDPQIVSTGAYPHYDQWPQGLLTTSHIFFCALFNPIVEELDTIHLGSHIQAEAFATQWRAHLLRGGNRSRLYASGVQDTRQQWFRRVRPPSAKTDSQPWRSPLRGSQLLQPFVGCDASRCSSRARRPDQELNTLIKAVSEYKHHILILFLSSICLTPSLPPKRNHAVLGPAISFPHTLKCHSTATRRCRRCLRER